MAEEAAVFENSTVAANCGGDSLTGITGGVFEGDVVCLEAGAIDLNSLGKEGPASLFGVERIRDDDVFGRLAHTKEGNVGVVLSDNDTLVIRPWSDVNEDAAGSAVRIGRREGMVIERHLDSGKVGCAVDVSLARGRDGHIDVGGVGTDRQSKQKW